MHETDARRIFSRHGLPVPPSEPLRLELMAFVKSIRSGHPCRTPGDDGARVVRVLDAAQESLEAEGREVRLRIR